MLQFKCASALLAALLLLGAPAAAQSSSEATSSGAEKEAKEASADAEECATDLSKPLFSEASASEGELADAAEERRAASPAEKRVQGILSEQGVHVVHLWAPWCNNSASEMASGWNRLVQAKANTDVSFTFVTVWNNGHGGARTIKKYRIPLERVTEVVPESPAQGRLDQFMGYAVHWVPSTWIFRTGNEGEVERVFAMNYGEMKMSTLQTLIRTAQADW